MRNKTALITGASDGIGVDFAHILAERGYNLILVARREARLQQLADELGASHSIVCTVLPCDLSQPGAADGLYQKTVASGLQVDFLVNNAGLLYNGFFTDLPLDGQVNLLMVNMVALTALTHHVVRQMQQRGGGHILNVASLAAWMAIPNENVYAASKAYVLSFSQALADEMQALESGVTVTALCPGYTATKMLNNSDQGGVLDLPDSMIMPSRLVAEQGIAGCLAGKVTVMPGFNNKVSAALTRFLPRMTMARMIGGMYRKKMR